VAGTELAVRAGTKLIVTAGLVAIAGLYDWVVATAPAACPVNGRRGCTRAVATASK
jgi:hypothetical protein